MHKEGWVIDAGRIRSATLIDSYEWKNVVRLRFGQGEMLTTADKFLEVKPETATQKGARLKRENRAQQRSTRVFDIRRAIPETPISILKLKEALHDFGYSYTQLHRRLHKWPEFEDVVKTLGENGRWMYSLPK